MTYQVTIAICDCTDPDCDAISCEDLVPCGAFSIEEAAEYLERDANELEECAENTFKLFNPNFFSIGVGLFKVTFSPV